MMNVFDFKKKKQAGEKIAMITCYDYTSAAIANRTAVDCLLVGDSLAMTMYGHASTLPATIPVMAMHTAAVAKGASDKFIVGDLPFLSYRKSLGENMDAAQALMQAGAHALKLEGAAGNAGFIEHLVQSGVPVMGHIGLTPQSVNVLGGYHVQGKTDGEARRLMDEAAALERAGCFAVVLECVPQDLAAAITAKLKIPTIGIGAGVATDGQVLVFQDLLGLNRDFTPKFVKKYLNGAEMFEGAINHYVDDVKKKAFPDADHSFGSKRLAHTA